MKYARALAELGLTPTESDVYLFLLQNGQCNAPQIQAALNLDKMPVYRALGTLRDKGYAESFGETRNQLFAAAPIQTILDKYEERARALAEAREGIVSLMHDLTNKQQALYKENRITIYEGTDGYKLWMEERLNSGATTIRELGQNTFVGQFFTSQKEFDDYMWSYIHRRISKGIYVRSMGDKTRQRPYDTSDPKLCKEARIIDLPERIDGIMTIFGNKFGFYTLQNGKYMGIIIDDPMLSKMMTLFYDALWEQGTPV
jgi:sugar-specific transcriptional regulator TrmB